MTTTFAFIPTGNLSAAQASRVVSLSGPAGHPKEWANEDAPATQWAQEAATAAAPQQLVRFPRADHFFTSQPEPPHQALSGWLKEQPQ